MDNDGACKPSGPRLAAWLAAALALAGCAGGALAPVEDGAVRAQREPSAQVVRGDTLYAFAWRYGFDHREIARWNGLEPPYTLRVGQRLRLMPPSASTPTVAAAPVAQVQALARAPAPVATAPQSPAPTSSPSPPAAAAAPAAAAPPAAFPPTAETALSPKPEVVTLWTPPKTPPAVWQWPLESPQVVRGFDPARPGGRGLDLAALPGAQVRAAAAGKVVYEGSGLPGYGRLIILKHTDSLLSAYGHLGGFHVKEGDIVESGQVLADLSNGGGKDAPVLRFEIRQDGQPRNPLAFLPG